MSDYDGDICFTTNNKTFLKCKFTEEDFNLPVTYEKQTVPKIVVTDDMLAPADIASFDTKIGQITNYSTSMYDMVYRFKDDYSEYGRKCYNELIERLKLTRKAQGDEIDHAKGVRTQPYPDHWIHQQRILPDDSEEIVEYKTFLNDICADRKPYFFKYRYSTSALENKKYTEITDIISMMHFGVDTKSLDEDDPSQYSLKTTLQESEILIDNNSPMNQICHYMEDHLADISRSEKYNQDIVDALIIPGIDTNNQDKIAYVKMMIDDFYNVKKNLKSKNSNDLIITNNLSVESYSNINQYAKAIRVKAFEFFDDEYELTNYIIKVCYILKYHNSKSFAWTCFGAQILNSLILNSKTKTAIFPVLDPNGSMDYLYNTYRLDTIDLSSIDTDKPTPEYNVEFIEGIEGEEEEDVTADIQ